MARSQLILSRACKRAQSRRGRNRKLRSAARVSSFDGDVLTNYHVVADCKDIRDIRMRVPGAPEESAKLVAFNVAISRAVINAGDVIDIGTAHLDSNGTFGAFGELKKSGRATASAGCMDW
jgi:hypothetical protein